MTNSSGMGKALGMDDGSILGLKTLLCDSPGVNPELTVQSSSHLCIQSALGCVCPQFLLWNVQCQHQMGHRWLRGHPEPWAVAAHPHQTPNCCFVLKWEGFKSQRQAHPEEDMLLCALRAINAFWEVFEPLWWDSAKLHQLPLACSG